MTLTRAHSTPASEEGFALIEVLVSALIVVIAGGAVLTTLQATARSAADSRNRTMAQAIAQEDQARLRSMRIPSLNRLNQTYPVTLDGTTFSVTSTGDFVNSTSQSSSCTGSNISADYVRITSSVTWPELGKRPPVVTQSIVSPSNGSLNPGNGTLNFSASNAAAKPLPGVAISGSGPANFSGTTDASGCAIFPDLPAASSYTVTPSAPGLVDTLGNPPGTLNPGPGVNSGGTTPVTLQYDQPGTIEVDFAHRIGNTASYKASEQRSIAIFNSSTGQSVPTFVSGGSSPVPSIKSGSLFTIATAKYAVYVGSCAENNPNPTSNPEAPGAEAVTGIAVTPGAAVKGTVKVPALNLLVKKPGNPAIKVKITGTCSFTREYSGTAGTAMEVGLPWGTYSICAQTTSSAVRKTLSSVPIQNMAAATSKEIDLGSGTSNGNCP